MSVRSLSDQQLLSRTVELTRCERDVTLRVLQHLNEIERRKLHLKLGYSSMFVYCTSGLGYSASAAGRRIQTARCVARFPEVRDLLESNEVNLTTISLVSRILRAETKDVILRRIRGKAQREVKVLVAEYEPREAIPRDHVRPIVIRRAVAPRGTEEATESADAGASIAPRQEAAPVPALLCEMSNNSRCGSAPDTPNKQPFWTEEASATIVERRTELAFAASETFMAKLGKFKSLAWHRLSPRPTLEEVFELAIDAFIAREDPEARLARREKRRERAETPSRPGAEIGARDVTELRSVPAVRGRGEIGKRQQGHRPRHVAAAVRDQVFVRDRGCCSYVGASGRVCGSTHGLQVDHIVPVARGGQGTPGNLRLLCAQHNRVEAERLGLVHGASNRRGTLPLRQ